MTFKEAARVLCWTEVDKDDNEIQEALLWGVWALMEQARYQD